MVNKLPKGMQSVYLMANKCCRVLMAKEGLTAEVAEEMVLSVLKKSEPDLEIGHYKKVEAALETEFFKYF